LCFASLIKKTNYFFMKKSKQTRKRKKKEEKLFVPAEILRVFKDAFPEVELGDVEWEWEVPQKIYEAEFKHQNYEYEVEITVTGHHLLTEVEIPEEEIPEVVKSACSRKFRGWKIDEVEKVSYSNGDVYYELELSKEKDDEEQEKEVLFREDALFIAEITEED